MYPMGGENWTKGTTEHFRWGWTHDPDPVHNIDLKISLVGCLGDPDRSFFTVIPGHFSTKKNGQVEEIPWNVPTDLPNTHIACARIHYSSPSSDGVNDSWHFTIWDAAGGTLVPLELALDPQDAQVPSGAKIPLTGKVGLTYRERWFPIWQANVSVEASAGNLSKNYTKSGLEGNAPFTYTAPKVAEVTNVTVKGCATHPNFVSACSSTKLSIIPPGKRLMFLDLGFEPDPPHGGVKNNVSVGVRNVTEILPGALVTMSSSDPQAKFDPVTGAANETGVFNTTWAPPDVKEETEFNVCARAVFAGYPEATHCAKVGVIPRPIPEMNVVPFLESNGVLDTGTARMRVVVTDSKGFLPGAFVNVVDSKGATVEPASSGNTDDRGEFTADVRPSRLAENETVKSLAIKINVTEPAHQPVETYLYVDVYRDPGRAVRPSGAYYGAVGVLLAAALLMSALGFIRRKVRRAPQPKLQADGGDEEKEGSEGEKPRVEDKKEPAADVEKPAEKENEEEEAEEPERKKGKPAAASGGPPLPLPDLLTVLGVSLALVALILSTPAGENALVDAGLKETTGGPPPQFTPTSEVAVVSNEVGVAVVEIAKFNRPVAIIHSGFGGHDLELDDAKDIVYVAHTKSGTVSAIDVRKLEILSTMSVGRTPRHIKLSDDSTRLWSLNDGDPSVSVLDTVKMAEIARIPLPAKAAHGDLLLSGETAYVSNPYGLVIEVGLSGVKRSAKVSLGAHEIAMASGKLFVGSKWNRTVDVLDAATMGLLNSTPLPGNATFVKPSPDGKEVLVGLGDAASVARLDAASGVLLGTFATVENPVVCTFSPAGKLAYIGSGALGLVFVNRLDNWTVQDKLPVGAANPKLFHPRAIAASANGFDLETTASADGSSWWVFEPHLNSHAVHSGGSVGANPIDVVIV
jgi:DNA-binding beta-propeller fold protein YncE